MRPVFWVCVVRQIPCSQVGSQQISDIEIGRVAKGEVEATLGVTKAATEEGVWLLDHCDFSCHGRGDHSGLRRWRGLGCKELWAGRCFCSVQTTTS